MIYDFDAVHNRRNTNSLKHDCRRQFGKPDGVIPLWVADMDFKVPPQVEDALVKCAKHGIFGYSEARESYWEALLGWFAERFNYHPEEKWLIKAPGVVFATALAIRALTNEGDGVMIQRPVYHPFAQIIKDNNRQLVNNPLIYENGAYRIDFADFERKIVENKVKLFILCSPHNPVGRVWTRSELEIMGDICLKYQCLILSDEIHCDFVFAPHKHSVFSLIKPELADISVIATAPSKTFNLPGLQISNIFISNPHLRRRFIKEYDKSGYGHHLNIMGLVACENAYRYGREWLDQLLSYLSENMRLIYDFCDRTGMKSVPLEGTYLAWLDFSPLGLSHKELDELIVNKAGLWLSTGTVFGPQEGVGFQRINIACPRSVLIKALHQLECAVNSR
ncbi:MAG: pyridoxal phosphate-dependent aminotransferase [Chitinispirillia bacterium]|nr:pyridoxal phosphate-dependent aminotransferase [Chitinispirillia bacterium]